MRRGYASNLVYARMKRGLTSRGRVCRVGGGGGWRESRGLKLARRLRAEIGLAKVNRGARRELRQAKMFLLNEVKRGYHLRRCRVARI
jgi:hypothetical protein